MFWHYSLLAFLEKTVHLRYAVRTKFSDIFLFSRFDQIEDIKNGEQVYLPNYAELDRVVTGLIAMERQKMLVQESLRTLDGEQDYQPRYKASEFPQATPRTSKKTAKATLYRSKLTVSNSEDEHTYVPFLDFYDDDIAARHNSKDGDLNPAWFSLFKLKEILERDANIDFTASYLSLEVNPLREDWLEHIEINGETDEVLSNNDQKFLALLKQFQYCAQNLGETKFVVDLMDFVYE